jgi:uracil-DNA glycosylase family 4
MNPKAPYADCEHCPLKSRPMCGSRIPEDAVLTVIGEKPGTEEIIDGVPFIGQSGVVLRQALEYSGVDPARVAMTNAVLCLPIGSDDPPEEAIRACLARLDYDIRRSGAKHIVAAGNVAARALDTLSGREVNVGIMARAGKTYDYARMVINNAGAIYDTDAIDIQNRRYRYTCTTNPAYVLRQDPYTPTYLRHMQIAINPIDRDFDINRVKFAVMDEANKARILQYMNSFDAGAPCAFDVETGDLIWFDTPARPASPLLCLVFTFEDWRSIIIPADMLKDRIVYEAVDNVLNYSKYNIIAHNGKFDQNVMKAREGIEFEVNDDTMLAHYALFELGAHGLKENATEYLGAPDYEEALIVSWFRDNGMAAQDKRDYAQLPRERLYKYAAIDGAVTLQLWRIFDAELKAKNLYEWPYKRVLMETANALPIMEQTGIGIDRAQLAHARAEFESALAKIEQTMTDMLAPLIAARPDLTELRRLMTKRRKTSDGEINIKTGKLKRGSATYEEYIQYNPKSPQQTSVILYEVLGLRLNKRLIKPTASNTGKEALDALPDHAFITELRQHRRIAKMVDTYVTSIERRLTVDDLIHVDFRLTGTEIGRLSAASGDHGIPRPDDYYGAVIRSMFTADPHDEDEVLVIADYNQAELRAFAHLAQVQFLLEKYRNGEDVHTETGIMLDKHKAPIFHGFEYACDVVAGRHTAPVEQIEAMKKFIKARRVLAKNVNFGKIYLGGAAGISGMIGGAVPASVIKEILIVYRQIMPEADEYAERQFAFLCQHGYVKTIFNRHRRFYVISEFNREEARKAAVHMVVAGSAADLTNLSSVRLVRQGVRLCHSVHDSLIARAHRSEAQQVADLMQSVMEQTGSEFMPSLPWIADIEVLKSGEFPRRWYPQPKRSDYDERGKLIV